MYIAYLTLLSGLFLSLISEYFSIIGLMAIFSASPITVAIMGVALGIGKIVSTVWIKQNWKNSQLLIKIYLLSAIVILMLITSIGCFGLLSKAHSDQNLVSGDVLAKIAIYDEKIKNLRDNIDANRKVLKQLDDAVDQIMSRSTSETGADKAVQVRRSQQKERARLLAEIQSNQEIISTLVEERAPIASEVRKVEADVGPIKYIAAFFYGATDQTILERAVTWVIILLILVFDPLALMLLIVSQISFQKLKKDNTAPDPYITDVGEPPTEEEMFDSFNEPVDKEEITTLPSYQFLDEDPVEEYTPVPKDDDVEEYNGSIKEIKWIYIPEDNEPETPKTLTPITQREESRVVKTKIFKRPGTQE